MVSRSNKERARAALDAMKVLGFSKKEATPVLKTLLKLFDNSWEPIEDECYRALADAILDARDCPQGAEHGSHGARMVAPEEDRHQPSTSLVVHRGPCGSDSETEAPLIKRPRTNPEEDGHQPSISLVVHGGPCDFETEAPLIRRPRTNSNNLSADHSIGPELFPSSSNTAHNRAKQMIDEDFQHAVFLREPKLEPDMDATQSFHDAQVGIVSHPFNTSPSGAADPHPLEVFLTQEGKGWGLRTLDELPKGTFICEYVGELLTNMELCERASEKALKAGNMYPVDLDADRRSDGVLKDQEVLCLDTTCYGNVARFINHRCYDANLVEIPVEMETPDYHYYHLALFTSKKVDAFEELTWDYGINFDDDKNPGRAFQCLCGSRYCRGRKRWRNRGKAAAKLAVVEGTRG
nr:unnamed protein product [Digitaria exilis]